MLEIVQAEGHTLTTTMGYGIQVTCLLYILHSLALSEASTTYGAYKSDTGPLTRFLLDQTGDIVQKTQDKKDDVWDLAESGHFDSEFSTFAGFGARVFIPSSTDVQKRNQRPTLVLNISPEMLRALLHQQTMQAAMLKSQKGTNGFRRYVGRK